MDNMTMQILKGMSDQDKKGKLKSYQVLNQFVKKGQILFTGSSLMEQFPIYEFLQDYDIKETIYNRGIGGYVSVEMLEALDAMIFDLEPSKIFINIGTNDLSMPNYLKEDLIACYEKILQLTKERLPQTKIYVMAYYPVNQIYDFGNPTAREYMMLRTNARIMEANNALAQMADKLKVRYIDVNRNLYDEIGNLKPEYSVEGIHMYPNGYRAILDDLMLYVKE